MYLPWTAWEKGMKHLVDGDSSWKSGNIAGSGFDVDRSIEA
jgi:hypothetical protein